MKNNILKSEKVERIIVVFFLVCISIFVFVMSYLIVFGAFTYTRTPDDLVINVGVPVQVAGHMEAPTVDIGSYRIIADTSNPQFSTCFDNGMGGLDEWDYDYTFSSLPIQEYDKVFMYTYIVGNYDCNPIGGEQDSIDLEVGTPAFEVIAIPTGNCDPVDKVCYYDWLVMNLFIIAPLWIMVWGFFLGGFYKKEDYNNKE